MNTPTIPDASGTPLTPRTSRSLRTARVLGSVLASCLVVLMAAIAVPVLQAHANSATTGAAQVPALSTSCPALGTARAASMPSMTLGSHPSVVYIVNEGTPGHPTFGTLKRYDTITGNKVEIVKLANTFMFSAQLSANGQWLLFVSQTSNQVKLQLIRMDGRFLQTLYCGPGKPQENILSVQWSTNQKYVVFLQLLQSGTAIDVLNMSTGALQADLTLPTGATFTPRTWLDGTRVYLTYEPTDSPPTSVYLLDTSKGANQNYHNLPLVFDSSAAPYCWDFDSSYDTIQLYTSTCTATQSGGPGHVTYNGPSSIAIHPATGGPATTIDFRSDLAFTSVRAATSNILFYLVGNTTGNTSQNGLWKVGADGSNPTLLAGNPGNTDAQLNQFSQFPWSNVSHDGTQYVLALVHTNQSHTTYTLEYGSLNGGALALLAYTLWPTWERSQVPKNIAARLEALRRYFDAVMTAYARPSEYDVLAMQHRRQEARLARTNAEASVARSIREPALYHLDPDTARGLIAGTDSLAKSILALDAYLLNTPPRQPLPAITPFTHEVAATLTSLIAGVQGREGTVTPEKLQEALRQLENSKHEDGDEEADIELHFVLAEARHIVNSLNAMGQLLRGSRSPLGNKAAVRLG